MSPKQRTMALRPPQSFGHPFQNRKCHHLKYHRHKFLMPAKILVYAHDSQSSSTRLGRRWLWVHDMHSFSAKLFFGMINNRNGMNMANIVTKLAEKIDRRIWRSTVPRFILRLAITRIGLLTNLSKASSFPLRKY